MPIRFRCVYCEKLLGIARRKAGAVVNCPHCGEKLIVPTPEEVVPATERAPSAKTSRSPDPEQPAKQSQGQGVGSKLFERNDFEDLLQPGSIKRQEETPAPTRKREPKSQPQPIPEGPPPFAGGGGFPTFPPLEPLPLDDAPPLLSRSEGIFISRARVTWFSVIALLVLAGTLALGIVIGKML